MFLIRDEALRFLEFFQLNIIIFVVLYHFNQKCKMSSEMACSISRLLFVNFLFSAELMQEDFSVDDPKDIKIEMYSKY